MVAKMKVTKRFDIAVAHIMYSGVAICYWVGGMEVKP
jgi:hypothetical protein